MSFNDDEMAMEPGGPINDDEETGEGKNSDTTEESKDNEWN